MSERVVYLDSSVIVKRYVKELGSERIREIFLGAYSGVHHLSFSIWNVGEVLGALDRARSQNRIELEDYKVARGRFLSETRRMDRIGVVLIIPVRTRLLLEAWDLVEKHHIYEADALQIATAEDADAVEFITSDRTLHEVAASMGMNSTCL